MIKQSLSKSPKQHRQAVVSASDEEEEEGLNDRVLMSTAYGYGGLN